MSKLWYHVSSVYLGDQVELVPRVPLNYTKGEKGEDAYTPRICVAPSIELALRASHGYWGKDSCATLLGRRPAFVYVTRGRTKKPPKDAVPDLHESGERWILVPHAFRCLGAIKQDTYPHLHKIKLLIED